MSNETVAVQLDVIIVERAEPDFGLGMQRETFGGLIDILLGSA